MARGITETDVHTAADEVVAAGERPTVERIRAHLGTGSPNTVTRWLETWWKTLGGRLQAQRARLDVPDAPEAVAVLAGEWWTLALQHARNGALEALANERSALQAEHQALQREREDLAAEIASLRSQTDAAMHAERVASTQATELQRLVERLQAQLIETSQQREAALARAEQAHQVGHALQQQLQQQQTAFQTERDQLTQHIRAVEDRAHQEVDRARQDIKELKAALSETTKAHARIEKERAAQAQRDARELASSIQHATAQQARADALQTQLATLKDLPSAVRAALAPHRQRASSPNPKDARGGRSRNTG